MANNNELEYQFELSEKICDDDESYGFNQLSIQIARINGDFDFSKLKKFINKNLIADSIDSEGFEKGISESNNEVVVHYCKEGKRVNRFATKLSDVLPKTLKIITQYIKIRFVKQDSKNTILYIYGGSESFINRMLNKILPKIAIFSNCKLIHTRIPQLFIRRLCLTSHRSDVEHIKIDPSKSKNYAKLIENENEKIQYEFIVKEGKFKGHNILNSQTMEKLFKEEPSIQITNFKSSFNVTNVTNKFKVKYEINTTGKINFHVTQKFMDTFQDEFKATEFLLGKIEEDANQQLLLTQFYDKSENQKMLPSFGLSSDNLDDLIKIINYHMDKKEYGLAHVLLVDLQLQEHNLNIQQRNLILDWLLEVVKDETYTALQMISDFVLLISDEVLTNNFRKVQAIFEKLSFSNFLLFAEVLLSTERDTFIDLCSSVIQKSTNSKTLLNKEWSELKIESNSNKKGKMLEEFLVKLFAFDESFQLYKKNLLTTNEEIDLTFKNKSNDSFWTQLNSIFLFVEAKNWSSKVDAKEVKVFKSKLLDHSNHTRVGFFIAVKGFTSGSNIEQIRAVKGDCILALITGKDIESFLDSNLTLKDFLEEKIGDSIQ